MQCLHEFSEIVLCGCRCQHCAMSVHMQCLHGVSFGLQVVFFAVVSGFLKLTGCVCLLVHLVDNMQFLLKRFVGNIQILLSFCVTLL